MTITIASDRNAALHHDVRLLGNLLGEVLREQGGLRLFEAEETLRLRARQRRESGDDTALVEAVETLPADLTYDVLRAFTVYFQLVNIAEQCHRIRRNRLRARENPPRPFSLDECTRNLVKEGIPAQKVQRVLDHVFIRPVFTAHPTESRRRTVMSKLSRMGEHLKALDRADLTPTENEHLLDAIHEEIVSLWQSDDVRGRSPSVMDEVNQGLYFLDRILLDVVPRIYMDFQRSLARAYPGENFHLPPFFTFGTWIGGDRDGNPFVTPDVTRESLRAVQLVPTRRYLDNVTQLFGQLSQSVRRVRLTDDLEKSLHTDRRAFGKQVADEVAARNPSEPYRQKLNFIQRRLQARLDWLSGDPYGTRPPSEAYRRSEELLHDLTVIEKALIDDHAEVVARGNLQKLIHQVRAFGLHLVVMDYREHRDKHRQALDAIFGALGRSGYGSLSDEERAAWLTEELRNPRPMLSPRLKLEPDVAKVPGAFQVLAQARETLGPEGIGACIVSMLQVPADALEVLVFLKEVGLEGQLDIAPLFETLEALENAPTVIETLLSHPIYRHHVRERGDMQEVLVGYSDSGKDVGFLASNWAIYQAQVRCHEVTQRHGVKLRLFHGRGGSVGRGGGPSHQAILGQPVEGMRGGMKTTEQGEVIASKYELPDIAYRSIEQVISATVTQLATDADHGRQSLTEARKNVMSSLAEAGRQAWRALVYDDADFEDFLWHVTPVRELSHLHLGSRPSARGKTLKLAELRAIPWIFSWTQTRAFIPSWYGVGTAFSSVSLDDLRELYAHWFFFRQLVNNISNSLAMVDLGIFRRYLALADNPQAAERIYQRIADEFELTKTMVLKTTRETEILANNQVLSESIQLRNPYVDPLSYLQIHLLKALRKLPENDPAAESLHASLLLSISGVAAGLRTVG